MNNQANQLLEPTRYARPPQSAQRQRSEVSNCRAPQSLL